MLQVGGNMNGFNTEAFQQTGYLFQYSNVTVSATSNYIGSYLAGFIFNMPPDEASTWNKLSVNFHILAGLMTARYSTITATYTDSLKASHSSVTSFQSAIAFEVDMGLGAVIHINKLIGIDFNIDIMGGNPVFKSYTVTEAGSSPTSYNENIGMSTVIYNFSAGIVFSL